MLSDESKRVIDRLTREDLVYEANRGRSSRFQGERFDYLKTRLDLLKQQESQEHVENRQELDVEANRIAERTNSRLTRTQLRIKHIAWLYSQWSSRFSRY